MAATTITDDALEASAVETGGSSIRLVFIADADNLEAPSSSHALDDVDEVRFHRGARSVERTTTAAGRTLVLGFPDDRMSATHGSLRRADDHWILEDPISKNRTVVDGALVRKAVLRDGTVFELGHSFFLLRHTSLAGRRPAQLAADVTTAELPACADGMATLSPALAGDYATLIRLAPSRQVSIVLRGETGTGKEVIAHAIHTLSKRTGPFVAVNCGSLPAALVEAELFGHRRGAFTGAIAERRGLIRSADAGTLFLDEIGELPPASQAALLRVLQEREVLPVGDDRPVAVDLRVVAATLRDLDAEIVAGRFRGDLYARLTGHVVTLPALRERREDLGLLISSLLRRSGRSVRLTPGALRACLTYHWPNNIRELEQALTTALALATDEVIAVGDLPVAVSRRERPVLDSPTALSPADIELREHLIALLSAHDGNVAVVAEVLGKQRAQIYKWVKRLSIDLARFRRTP